MKNKPKSLTELMEIKDARIAELEQDNRDLNKSYVKACKTNQALRQDIIHLKGLLNKRAQKGFEEASMIRHLGLIGGKE